MTEVTQYRIEARSASGLVQEVEAALAAGQLEPGERLPSVRRLAAEAGLSPATAAAGPGGPPPRGVIGTQPRRGPAIRGRPPPGPAPPPPAASRRPPELPRP